MSGVWRTGLIVAVVVAAVWLCAIVYWRGREIAPSGGQMLLWLGVLPIGALAGLWLLRRLRAGGRDAGPQAATGDRVVDTEPAAMPPRPPSEVLAVAVRLPHGDAPDTLLTALRTPPRPGLHPRLRDRDGLPVFAAFVDELDVDPVRDMLARAGNAGLDARAAAADEAPLRALALLEPVAVELFDAATRWLPPLPVAEERVVAGLRRRAAAEAGVAVRVSVLLPAAWPQPLRQACGDWLLDLAQASGLDAARIALDTVAVREPGEVWRRIDRIGDAAADDAGWHLLLACDSQVSERGVQALLSAGRLMESRRPEGLVPGEGAAGILLRPPGAPAPAQPALALLHRTVRCTLDDGVRPRAASQATAELAARALQGAELAPDAVSLIVSDADQRPSRSLEAAGAAAAACPELESDQCATLGVTSGDIGTVAPLALLALAAARVRAAGQPALALAVAPERERVAAALAPIAATATDAASSSDPPTSDAGTAPGLAA